MRNLSWKYARYLPRRTWNGWLWIFEFRGRFFAFIWEYGSDLFFRVLWESEDAKMLRLEAQHSSPYHIFFSVDAGISYQHLSTDSIETVHDLTECLDRLSLRWYVEDADEKRLPMVCETHAGILALAIELSNKRVSK